MAPPYSSIAIANEFVRRSVGGDGPGSKWRAGVFHVGGRAPRRGVDPLKLQKLVYFAHGWHLAVTGRPLIKEMVEAWKYGPVVRPVYHKFKKYGRGVVDRPVQVWAGSKRVLPHVPGDDTATHRLLDKVWETYGGFTGVQLSAMSHEPGTPWSQVFNEARNSPYGLRKGTDIPDATIHQYFVSRDDPVEKN